MKKNNSKVKTILTKSLTVLFSVILVLSVIICVSTVIQKMKGDTPSIFGYRIFIISTESMTPTLPVDSVVIVKSSDSYEKNDIITFVAQSGYIKGEPNTHRIVDIVEEDGIKYYITKGDYNDYKDPDKVTDDIIFGKVVKSYTDGSLRKIITFLTKPMGFLFIILIPVVILAVLIVIENVVDYKKAIKEEVVNEELIKQTVEKLKDGSKTENEKD